MTNLKKILDESAKFLTCLIPFMAFTKKGRKIMEKDNPKLSKGLPPLGKKNWIYISTALITALIGCMGPIIYSVSSLEAGSFNYKKWPEIENQRQVQKEIQNQKNSYEILQKYDLDNGGSLDSTEFLNYYKKTHSS